MVLNILNEIRFFLLFQRKLFLKHIKVKKKSFSFLCTLLPIY